ncbi:Uncharacterised protein [Mycobacterium tuberculosis]|nr:Uncharacterised protein [Mycobacterium tuberculosis]COZ86245.1 Uncharacterised protein [Mycobacterium tuberculosis]
MTESTSSRAARNSATRCALATCRSIRRLSVSRPCATKNALNGEAAEP